MYKINNYNYNCKWFIQAQATNCFSPYNTIQINRHGTEPQQKYRLGTTSKKLNTTNTQVEDTSLNIYLMNLSMNYGKPI